MTDERKQAIELMNEPGDESHMITKHVALLVGALGFGLGLTLFTPVGAVADEGDPPSRVARLAFMEGSVSFEPAGTDEWVAPPLNRPLTTGDRLWSDRDSRAELQLDGSLLRMASNTAVAILNLGDEVTQIQLSAGTLVVQVRRLDDIETYEIDTPNLAFSILRPGYYRIAVDETGVTTAIQVRAGQGEATGGGSAYTVRARDYVVFSGTDELHAETQSGAPREDSFDAWSAGRDSRWQHSESARYVSSDVVGYEDLDDHGSWNSTPEYGYVWFPRGVDAGWAPYHNGHWAYIAPWGYTWVDDQPWGFAPFHYGRWVSVRGAWGWVPSPPREEGAIYVRPVYAPALVAWVGVGAGVAWFALGPREVFVPSYPVSRSYVNNVNVSNTTVNATVVTNVYNTTVVNRTVTNVTNVTYVNRGIPGAVTATTSQAFASAQPVARNRVAVDQGALASAHVQATTPAAIPMKQAVLGSGPAASAKPPATVQTRAIVARTTVPPPPPTFERRQDAIRSNGGNALSVAQAQQIQPSAAQRNVAVRLAPPAIPAATRPPARAPASSDASQGTERLPARPPTPAAEPTRSAAVAAHPAELPVVPKPPSPSVADSALERQHLQEQQRLRAMQEDERRSVQQQQQAAHEQLARQQADDARKQQLEQQHQQQTQQLMQKHVQEQQQLEGKQREQRRQVETKPPAQDPRRERPPNEKP
jgi:hypothetical protein